MDEAYLKVLQMIQDGVVSAAEGETLLDSLEAGRELGGAAATAAAPVPPAEAPPDAGAEEDPLPPAGPPAGWQRLWIYPLIGGIVFLALAGLLTGDLIRGGRHLGWLACTIPLLLFGALVALLAWWSRRARWLHLYVRDAKKVIRFSLPLPLRLTATLLRFARPWVPALRDTAVDELILALAETDVPGSLLTVEVTEAEDEEVRVYIG